MRPCSLRIYASKMNEEEDETLCCDCQGWRAQEWKIYLACPPISLTRATTWAQKQASPPLHASPIPRHLLAHLKVTCRRRWMCGLQPLKCPHEAKELFVSLEELQSLGWGRNRRVMLLSCFHHNWMTPCHRWEGTQLLYEIHSAHQGKRKVRELDDYFSWQNLIPKQSLKQKTQADSV